MERWSWRREPFCSAVTELFERPGPIVATVQLARHPFTDSLKRRADVERVKVTVQNRDELPEQLFERAQQRRAGA